MIAFSIESLSTCWNEVMALGLQHWSETENFRRGEDFCPSYDRYIQCEQIGFFAMFTARSEGRLVGYAGMYVTQSMHSQATIAVEDTWFLLPDYRKGRNAIRFVKFVESELEARGVTAIMMSAKIANGAGRILVYLDYKPVSVQHFKTLGRADSAKNPPLAVTEEAQHVRTSSTAAPA